MIRRREYSFQSLATAERLFAPQLDPLAGELSQHITNAVATACITWKESQTQVTTASEVPA